MIFSIKSKFVEAATQTLIITFFVSALVIAYVLRIFERPLSDVSEQNYNSFYTSFWNVIITMTTVGYGDVYPKSIGGRILGMTMCIWGVLLMSLFVVTVSQQLELTTMQQNAYVLIQRIVYKDALKRVAASALFSMFKFSKAMRDEKDNNVQQKPQVLNHAENNFKRKMLMFNNKSAEMRKFDTVSEFAFLAKNTFWDDIQLFKQQQDVLSDQQDKILEMLGGMLTKKGVDFEAFLKKIEEDEANKQSQSNESQVNTTKDGDESQKS